MNNWKRFLVSSIRFKKLRTRFLFAMIALSIPPLFILGYFSFQTTTNTMMRTHAQTNSDHLKTASEMADLLFRNLINLNRALVLNESIRNELIHIKNGEQAASPSGTSERMAAQIQRVINTHLLDNRFVNSICILDYHFQIYCLGRSDDAGTYEHDTKITQIQNAEWYQKAVNAEGRVIFYGTDVLSDTKDSFSTIKLFRDSEGMNGESLGVIIVNVSKNIFDSAFNVHHHTGSYMAIEDTQLRSRVVFPDASEGDHLVSPYSSASEAIQKLKEEKYLVSSYRNETTNWTFIHSVQKKELLAESNRIGTATMVIALLISLTALVLSYILSGTITKPLISIKKMMMEWNKGKREFTATFEQDEVGVIGETFKRMASENDELNEKVVSLVLKEREAELRALQAQIKPHFLYNTLDSIYWMAMLKGSPEAAQMAISLSESFKLSLNKGKELIPIFKELQHIKHYLNIQNIRYNNRFHFEEDIEESMMSMEMIKLLLQPLVENAIYHGLEPKVGEGRIRLTGRREGEFIVFRVEDDGVGIEDPAAIEHGYGLSNVKERLRLYYGSSSRFQIASIPGKGTCIELSFKPLTQEEGRRHA
ncbi:sensor histidine kinase [Paenibacillus urinalis]|uniref:Sensor histidine kinase n=1 Tax=Paenibacillus urinalis TaxID=521520 RepID=A0AAX3MVU5_9BACL|nr:sensor histidine kinase [Paenibacillus urinalis]WDH80944.1 sensor histidine kinase [Paenibacillus urinalis]WDH96997.1 sensor histidine kinase [Paenibacillus urinalis]WDI00644.1 sensor histidine kinase [Paenibacillus urinalis]